MSRHIGVLLLSITKHIELVLLFFVLELQRYSTRSRSLYIESLICLP